MKKNIRTALAIALSIALATSVVFAAEIKTPDVKGAAKVTLNSAKAGATSTKDSAKYGVTAAKGKIIDINTATEAELRSVPNIGSAYATKIIAGRPFANKAQLKSRNILPTALYEQVKDLIIAKQTKTEAKSETKPTPKKK